MNTGSMTTREAIAGWLHMAIGALVIVLVVALWLAAASLASLFEGSFVPELFRMFGRPVAIFLLAVSGLQVIAAIALVRRYAWARGLLLGYSVMLLLAFPIGTAVGIFTFWALLTAPAEQAYEPEVIPPPPKEIGFRAVD